MHEPALKGGHFQMCVLTFGHPCDLNIRFQRTLFFKYGIETMRLGYFTMPVHPLNRDYPTTLQEDRETIILCDKLGFHDAFVGEHLTDSAETITNSMMFQATLIHATENIKLASGTTNLSHMHPVLVATHAAMFDNLARGRFILGVSPGALRSDAEALGILDEDRNQIFAEAIDVILAIWAGETPYDIDFENNRFKVTTAETRYLDVGYGIMPKTFQQPRPEIVGTVVAPFSRGVIAMGERDFHPLSANFLLPKWAATHWGNYAEGKANVGEVADPADWRIARTIFVADDDATAKAYGKDDTNSPYRFYYSQILKKMIRGNRQGVFKQDQDAPDDSVTLDRVIDDLVICGTVNEVVDKVLALRETTGDFGELVYAGMDWVDEGLTKRSLQLMAEEVMPRVNAAIAAAEPAAAAQ
jgi:alkanesulfonate monooxygenase SsuD/methylene tetrahydromethanopterin reductase-like flavin-dependent oxidoreductase (luciferase family)